MAKTDREQPAREAASNPAPAAPPLGLDFVTRPRLVSRLRQARDFRVVLAIAPAGYAKTSLLAEWASVDERPFAWVILDARDDRPSRLLNRLVEAMDSVSLGEGPSWS